jgi:phosphoribosylanthranilate isomerase
VIIKICGITNAEDSDAAVAGGATAIGFNFYSKSPRYIWPERAAEIRTPAGVRRVGIFVNESRARVEKVISAARLDVAQLHGDETSGHYPATAPVWKALRVEGSSTDIRKYDLDPAEALLLDGPRSGVAFAWALTKGLLGFMQRPHRIILAGGLDASNVAEAVAKVHPWGVDACSRIESAPGKKDHKKMTEFLQAAAAALKA